MDPEQNIHYSKEEIHLEESIPGITLISFSGTSGKGSKGNDNAQYIISIIESTLKSNSLNALIVDFSKIEYKFGNTMFKALSLQDMLGLNLISDDLLHAVIYKDEPKNKDSLFNWFKVEQKKKDVFCDLESAKDYIKQQIR